MASLRGRGVAVMAMLVAFLAFMAHPGSLVDALSITDTITGGGDNSRSGYRTTHNMDPAVVGSDQFGILWKTALPGNYRGYKEQVFSHPLVYTPGDTQYVYISTTMNYIHKINAKTGEILISRQIHIPFLTAELDGCLDINPMIGVTGTGVIDPETNTWYFTSKTYRDQSDQEKGRLNGRYFIHAVDVNTLAEKPGFPVNLENTVARNNPTRWFQGGNAHQRTALLHQNGYIYAGFASHCVQYNFTGWIMGWDSTGKVVEAFATQGGPESVDIKGGGVWMSGGGLASDGASSMWFATGNGYASQLHGTPVAGRQPPTALEEAAVHMTINDDGTLTPVDFFMPHEKEVLDGNDQDLGTSPLVLLPNQFSCPNMKRLGVVTGKSGKSYVLNIDDLGGYCMGPNKLDAVPQVWQNQNSVYAGAGVYPLEGGYIYINVIQFPTQVYKFSCSDAGNAVFTKVAVSPENTAYILGVGHGTTTSLNDQPGTGLLWVSDVQGFNLRVYKAVPNNGYLERIKALNIPGSTKFMRPSFGDGRAYVGTVEGLVYGIGSPVNPPLTCSSPYDFGDTLIGQTSAAKTISCRANINTQVDSISIRPTAHFVLSGLPTLPRALTTGQNISFQAAFKPLGPGPLSDDVYLNTTNGVAQFSRNTPVALKGVGRSANPLLSLNPNYVSFGGVITGANPGGIEQSIIFLNQGDAVLTIDGITYTVGGNAVAPTSTPDGPKVGPFTFKALPASIAANSQQTVVINFNPTVSGAYSVSVSVRSNGGTKVFQVTGTAGDVPKAKLEFQTPDGTGWVPYSATTNFTFASVYQSTTKNLLVRLTNDGGANAATLSVTVSKPPVGGALVGARNSIDLGEGTTLGPGQSATATVYCSVPKVQVNTPSYKAGASWTMNTNDPSLGKVFMQFDCTAIAEQVGPLQTDGSAVYPYVGCAKENNPGRQLSNQLYGSADNTNAKCITTCANAGYKYAGTQYQSECWCGNTKPLAIEDDLQCNYNCAGNQSQICGGNGYFQNAAYISLFSDPTKPEGIGGGGGGGGPGAVINPGNANFEYLGCFKEATNGRTLPHLGTASNTLTIATCLTACANYKYAGAEYGSECWCGDTLDLTLNSTATECNMGCAGNGTEVCGAGSRLTLYGRKAGTSPLPTGGPVHNPGNDKFKSMGCWTEATGARALPNMVLAGNDMTIAKCLTACSAYKYAGAEYSQECFCGDTLHSTAKQATLTDCNMVCKGNSSEYCGGGSRLNLYSVSSSGVTSSTTGTPTTTSASSTATGPAVVTGDANFQSIGCYTEATGMRALSEKTFADNTMTVQKCLTFCGAYQFAGVEYGRECYCGSKINTGSTNVAITQCNMLCAGDKQTYCGAGNRLNMYEKKAVTQQAMFGALRLSPPRMSVSNINITTPTPTGGMLPKVTNATLPSGSPTNSVNSTSYPNITAASVTPSNSMNATSITLPSLSPSNSVNATAHLSTPLANITSASHWPSPSMNATSITHPSISPSNSMNATSHPSTTPLANITRASHSPSISMNLTTHSLSTVHPNATTASISLSNSLNATSISLSTPTVHTTLPSASLSLSNSMNATSNTGLVTPSLTTPSHSPSNSMNSTSHTQPTSHSTTSSLTNSSSSAGSSTTHTTVSGSISVSANATATTATSTGAQPTSTGGWVYLGCANETNPRALSGASRTGHITIEKCQEYCLNRKFPVAGLENGDTCYCGSALQSNSTLGYDGCNAKCEGDQSQICGGVDRLSVYNYTLEFAPIVVPSVGSYLSQGCYAQPKNGKALSSYSFRDGTHMTAEFCVEACQVRGYGWAGVEAGQDCHCDHSLHQSASHRPKKECETPCAGDGRQYCGGNAHLIVYHDQPQNMTEHGVPKSGSTKND